jgi:transketolase
MTDVRLDAELSEKAVKTIQMLSADAVQKAKSGHPGLPMGAADVAFVLWSRYLRFCPDDPQWPNRDRFVLSAGHGSMLLYSLLHLFEFDLPMEQLQSFRQWGSKTPGHPEYGETPGVEVTTGPLGQGFANGVGMAIASQYLATQLNTDDFKPIDHYVYALCSDGDLMEGVSSEAASIAGHLGLGNIIYFYDDNHITIEGNTDLAFSEDVGHRFEAYGWHVLRVDGHNHDDIAAAIRNAQAQVARPTLIMCRTHIGKGSPNKQDKASAHGEPLGEDELRATKENIGWPLEPSFLVPDDVRAFCHARAERLRLEAAAWRQAVNEYGRRHPDWKERWDRLLGKHIPDDLEARLLSALSGKPDATRNSSGEALQVASELVPSLMGGSADLAPSTKTLIKSSGSFAKGCYDQRNLHFGIREHGMGAILNGMARYGGLIPYGSTFLVFADYMRPPIRIAALAKHHVIYVFTHDSIFVGEDGPTHEPIEQLASLRAIPGLTVIRPADPTETAAAWAVALRHSHGPVALVLTRQTVPILDRSALPPATELARGAYVLADGQREGLDLIIIATGSEVELALGAREALQADGKSVRVVSMPSTDLFEEQSEEYRREVLPPACKKRVVIEAASPFGWERYAGDEGLIIGINRFGASAPYKVLAEKFGFTVEKVVEKVRGYLSM